MSSRKGQQSRSSIDNVLDDLLGSDTDTGKKPAASKPVNTKPAVKPVKLTSDASDSEFYKNLKSIGGNEIPDDFSEDEELSDDAAKRIVDNIGDLDDLDDDLFAGLGGPKKIVKKKADPKQSSPQRKKSVEPSYNPDDPLAGLGLSEDEEFSISKKKTTPHKKPLSRRLSGDKMRIEPKQGDADDKEPYRSPTIDIHDDPFLTSNAKEGKQDIRRSSFDDTGSENDISPRHSVEKQSRHKSRRKVSVEPSPPKIDEISQPKGKTSPRRSSSQQKPSKKTADDDIFGDSDGLPGLSDEESLPQKKVVKKKVDEDDIPANKASSALDNLLSGSSSSTKSKKEPTMLEQIMSGKVKKTEAKKEVEQEELQFGGYTPSVGSGNNRPTTAPSSRSVRFADDLGLELDDSFSATRPSSAPEKKKSLRNRNKILGVELDSSLDESSSDWFSNAKKKGEKNEKEKKEQPKANKKLTRQSSKDDWLGLGEDLTDQLVSSTSGELFSPRKKQTNENESSVKKTEKTKSADIDLTLPWETPLNKSRTGRRQTTSTASSLLAKESDNTTDKNQIESNDHVNATKIESNDSTRVIKDKQNLEQKVENDFVNLLKQKKASQSRDREPSVNTNVSSTFNSQAKVTNENNPQMVSTAPTETVNLPLNSATAYSIVTPQPENARPMIPDQTHPSHPISSQQAMAMQQSLHYQIPSHNSINSQLFTPDLQNIQLIKEELQRDIEKQHQEEFNATKRQFERDKSYLESELRELQDKVLKIEEVKSTSTTDYSSRIRDMESKVRKLELERDQLLLTQESLRQRHKDELNALEISHKNRMGFLEASYQRREEQLKEEAQLTKSYVDEKIQSLQNEKEDLVAGFKKKNELLEKNRITELERVRELHKKSLEEFTKEHSEQMEHMRMLKEQEVAAAVNAFSHTKSLQSLISEVQNSTREVSQLQSKLDATHHSKLEDREQTLKSKDEYLRKLETRLQQQEVSNDAEREKLQNLVSKLEIQLREQTRHIEQDKWKLNQDENRLKATQAAFEEERRVTTEQLMRERQQLTKAREDMLTEQRRVVTECYEEKRNIAQERTQLTELQRETIEKSRHDRSSTLQAESDLEATLTRYQHESNTFNTRLSKVKQEEASLLAEKEEFVKQQKLLKDEFDKLNMAGKEVQQRSQEIDEFAVEARKVHNEGLRALEEAHVTQAEFFDARNQLEVTDMALQAQENALRQEKEQLESERRTFEQDKQLNRCHACKGLMSNTSSEYTSPHKSRHIDVVSTHGTSQNSHVVNQSRQVQFSSPYLKPAHGVDYYQASSTQFTRQSDDNNNILTSTPTSTVLNFTQDSLQSSDIKQKKSINNTNNPLNNYPPPDLLMNNFEFKRALRRWSTAKEKDDEFFEEETKFLKSLQQKRLR